MADNNQATQTTQQTTQQATQQTTQQQTPWYTAAGADGELGGYITNRGWDKLTPDKAAIEAAKAHREASRFIGVPEAQLVKLPTDPNSPDWAGVYERLGAPKEAKDYGNFETVKFKDGSALDADTIKFFQEVAHRNHLTKDAAVDVAKALVNSSDAADDRDNKAIEAQVAVDRKTLFDSWGNNKDVNLIIIRRTAEKLGIDAAGVNALESQVGYKATMETLLKIGQSAGEDSFVRQGGGNPSILSADQAKARISELKANPDWARKYLAGGTTSPEFREMENLVRLSLGN